MERLLEIPIEMLKACRYYKERDNVLRLGLPDAYTGGAYVGPLLSDARRRTAPHSHVALSIMRNERALNFSKWRRMSCALRSTFPTAKTEFVCPLQLGGLHSVDSEEFEADDDSAIEDAIHSHGDDE